MSIRKKLIQAQKHYYYNILGLTNQNEAIKDKLNFKGANIRLKRLNRFVNVKDKKLLDVGSGIGDFIIAASKYRVITFGVEPNKKLVQLSRKWAKNEGLNVKIRQGTGERLPFDAEVFDVVTCNSVLEHSKNPKKVLYEMSRVLKKGGVIYLQYPNYIYPIEPHYGIFGLQYLPRSIARFYLKFKSKNTSLFEGLNYLTPMFIYLNCKKCNLKIEKNIIADYLKESGLRWLPANLVMWFAPDVPLILRKNKN